ncbi:pilus assembly protein PilS [Neisseria meningitidis]|nr:pilus assembly protein PilS [Neisseria meningitidis]MBG8683303.1 pilus assembly protein PilS [Neisseria meningitidis]MBG8715814.1 pilus assembly protein PilS [Neisseria meningitidis]MBG8719540.1 pilus assembly protein PilS [Neisseria meningitidis]MBG8730180.1 pilus assembly protein PilS [Neisseria meningitidis]
MKPNRLDSRLRGNDESIHTETCTTSFPRTYIPSFTRKWESKTKNLKKPFYLISFRTDRSGFPPARE